MLCKVHYFSIATINIITLFTSFCRHHDNHTGSHDNKRNNYHLYVITQMFFSLVVINIMFIVAVITVLFCILSCFFVSCSNCVQQDEMFIP